MPLTNPAALDARTLARLIAQCPCEGDGLLGLRKRRLEHSQGPYLEPDIFAEALPAGTRLPAGVAGHAIIAYWSSATLISPRPRLHVVTVIELAGTDPSLGAPVTRRWMTDRRVPASQIEMLAPVIWAGHTPSTTHIDAP